MIFGINEWVNLCHEKRTCLVSRKCLCLQLLDFSATSWLGCISGVYSFVLCVFEGVLKSINTALHIRHQQSREEWSSALLDQGTGDGSFK